MPYTPLKGRYATIKYATVVRPAINWTVSIDGNVVDMSNFRDGRKADATLNDADVSWTEIWDTDAPPTATIKPGEKADVALAMAEGVSPLTITAPVTIATVAPQNEGVNGRVLFAVTAKLNGDIDWS